MPVVRAKMRCIEKLNRCSASAYGAPSPMDSTHVKLAPVVGPGNEEWSKWTPGGSVEMHINNPAAVEKFEVGKDYFVDFTPVEPELVKAE